MTLRRTVPLAAAVHAAMLALAWRVAPEVRPPPSAAEREVDLEPIDLGPALEPPPDDRATSAASETTRAASERTRAPTADALSAAIAKTLDEGAATSPEAEGARDAPLDDGPAGDVHAWERPSARALGVTTFGAKGAGAGAAGGEKNAFYKYTAGADGPADGARASRDVARDVSQTLLDHDRALGLGADGPVIGALETAAYAAPLPSDEARCVVDVTIGADGEVTSIAVGETNGERGLWERLAKDALALVRGKRAHVPAGAKGVALRIELTSRVQLPSGHAPSTSVSVLGLPAKKGHGKDPVAVTILDPLPKLTDVPLDREGKIKVPIPMVNLTIFGTNADPTDLSMAVRRVIGAKVLSERLL